LIAIELLAAAQGLDFQTQTAAMAARICLAIAQLHPAKHRSAKLNCFDCQCVGISS
jgi:histidine ammonia-lyase